MVHVWELGSGTQPQRKANMPKRVSSDRLHRSHSITPRSGAEYVTRSEGGSRSAAGWKLARTLFFVAAFLLLFTGFSFMRSFADESTPAVPAAEEAVVIADSGDTLWSIAAEVKRSGMDTRQAVHRIMERNSLTSSSLDVGTSLIVPVEVTNS
ncbi:LysM peptidoglycan-binding domain-containing protein [Cohnella sp. AR92]|uniref:LysM peptidoglycan-binding domain-containing protein n=1 Tax=Cohnella sp. AR92 TaxID=648716 RepID=UPI0013152DE1|nr:LysM peptidoglycan-binding domain-containing protein [Cohnella sp. AR92]